MNSVTRLKESYLLTELAFRKAGLRFNLFCEIVGDLVSSFAEVTVQFMSDAFSLSSASGLVTSTSGWSSDTAFCIEFSKP